MNRRFFLRTGGLTLGAVAFMTNRSIAKLIVEPAWKITMLTNDTGVFTERGGTILFYLSKDGIVIVDSQFPDQSRHLINELKNRSTLPYRLLINTHHHGDHSGGNIAFKGLVPHVLAHENSKINQQKVAIQSKNEDKQLYPDQTFTTTWCEKIGKKNICLHYFGPGHTNGDSLIQLEHSNVVHMGDLLFNRRHPFIDRTAGANINSWIKVLDKTVTTFSKKTKFVCGHAAEGFDIIAGKEDVKQFTNYLEKILELVQSGIKSGKTKEEIIKATLIPGAPEWKGDGAARPLAAAYDELTLL